MNHTNTRTLQNKDLEASCHEAETRLADFSDEVELATLDKEMAEERLDQSESALVSIKDELETLKVELASLQEIQGTGDVRYIILMIAK